MAQTVNARVSTLERMMEKVAYVQQETQIEIRKLSEEMRAFKEEMKVWRQKTDEHIAKIDERMAKTDEHIAKIDQEIEEIRNETKSMNKQWGDLANRLGRLVEDVFGPSIDVAIEKFFDCRPDIVDQNKLVRKRGEESLELDILAICSEERKAFVVEVKSNPDREEYINKFEQKIGRVKRFIPYLSEYKITPVYAALSMKKETIARLTKRRIYAMVVKGDILEVVNIDEIAEIKR